MRQLDILIFKNDNQLKIDLITSFNSYKINYDIQQINNITLQTLDKLSDYQLIIILEKNSSDLDPYIPLIEKYSDKIILATEDSLDEIINQSNSFFDCYDIVPIDSKLINYSLIKFFNKSYYDFQFYKKVINNVFVGVYKTNLKGELLYANEMLAKIFGYNSVDDIKNVNVNEFYWSLEDRRILIEELKKSQRFKNFLIDFKNKKGERFSALINSYFDRNEGVLYGIILDIDKLSQIKISKLFRSQQLNLEDIIKKRTAVLIESNTELSKFYSAVEQSPVSVIITDIDGNITYVNKAFENVTGYSLDEVIGNNPNILKSGYHDSNFYKKLWNTISSGKQWVGNLYNRRKNGELYWEHTIIKPIKGKTGKIESYVAVKEDITEDKERENELKLAYEKVTEANNELRVTLRELRRSQEQIIQSEKMAALGQLIAGIAHEINSPLGAIKSQNDLFTREVDTILYEYPKFIKGIPDNYYEIFIQLILKLKNNNIAYSTREEHSIKRKLFEKFQNYNIHNINKAVSVFSKINEDELKNFEFLFNYEKIDEFIDMVYKISNIILSSDVIHESIERIIKVLTALRHYSHQDKSETPVEANLVDTIETVLTIYHNKIKYNIELIKDYQFNKTITCYPDDLIQLWSNLINNAIQAMDYKGKLEIKVYEEKDNVVVEIKDTGKGIPKEIQDKIFEPFFTTKPLGEGTGIGLDIVKKIVNKHKGDIKLYSEENIGTTFVIKLPKDLKGVSYE